MGKFKGIIVSGPTNVFKHPDCEDALEGLWKTFVKITPRVQVHTSMIAASIPEKLGCPSRCCCFLRYNKNFKHHRVGDPRFSNNYITVNHDMHVGTPKATRFTLYAHQLIVIRMRQERFPEDWKWTASNQDNKRQDISHDCHRKWCVEETHIRLSTTQDNVSRSSQHCINYSECRQCRSRHNLCSHEPRCKAVKYVVCTKCAGTQVEHSEDNGPSVLDNATGEVTRVRTED